VHPRGKASSKRSRYRENRIKQREVRKDRGLSEERTFSHHVVIGSVEDDGRSFDVEGAGSESVGLQSMKERTALLGGEFRLAPEPGVGTKVVASIPLAAE
jgi:NarL family two-component system sensor histidine kinase LiaS